jgi:hypothetical protein
MDRMIDFLTVSAGSFVLGIWVPYLFLRGWTTPPLLRLGFGLRLPLPARVDDAPSSVTRFTGCIRKEGNHRF